MDTISIYALKDPRDDSIHYIGQSVNLDARMCQHLNDVKDTPKTEWINELSSIGLEPEMVIIESGLTPEEANETERQWIAQGIREGWPLTNRWGNSQGNNDFGKWLAHEMGSHGWTNSGLARKAGISHARISQVLSGEKPGCDFLTSIADGLNIPRESILRRAGILPELPTNITYTRLVETARILDETDQAILLKIATALAAAAAPGGGNGKE